MMNELLNRTAAGTRETARARKRVRLRLHGCVQGVGLRPFVCRLAAAHSVNGFVRNTVEGVDVEAEGRPADLEAFAHAIRMQAPAAASILDVETVQLDPAGDRSFVVEQSRLAGNPGPVIAPDLALCADCTAELLNPADRRYRYPFISCTACGPRYSIVESLPYDRSRTSMRHFDLCDACRAEYGNPHDRRFHAEPIACPACGPALLGLDGRGQKVADGPEAYADAVAALEAGEIVAVKGLGGFHLMVDAGNSRAVERLRSRKRRAEKPFAVMVPDSESAMRTCEVSEVAHGLLTSAAAPIVLLRRRPSAAVVAEVAPGSPMLGLLLPYTPLHHLILTDLGRPLVATSANLSEEPMCLTEAEVARRLPGIPDYILTHNRPIVRHVDDSIVRVMRGRPVVLRRARGYVPGSVFRLEQDGPCVGLGAHEKNTVTVFTGRDAVPGPHIGDLESVAAADVFERTLKGLVSLCGVTPVQTVHDRHPDYFSTQYAGTMSGERHAMQHHHAHIVSCMAEHGLYGPVLGIAWDGTGYGGDGTVWGGEFLLADRREFRRLATLRPFRLPGGSAAVREPRRMALSLLHQLYGDSLADRDSLPPMQGLGQAELRMLCRIMESGAGSPLATSMGRLFDGVAALCGLKQVAGFEGQAAMLLEYAAQEAPAPPFRLPFAEENPAASVHPWILDWRPMVDAIVHDVLAGKTAGWIARRFHETLALAVLRVARRAKAGRVVLSGGCFQNALLVERVADRLDEAGIRLYTHQRVPPNDGGISVGQVAHLMAMQAAGGRGHGRCEEREVPPCA